MFKHYMEMKHLITFLIFINQVTNISKRKNLEIPVIHNLDKYILRFWDNSEFVHIYIYIFIFLYYGKKK